MIVEIIESTVEFIKQPFIRPLLLSSGAIEQITEARAKVWVRVGGREAVGTGAIYLSDLWAWPDPSRTHEQRDRILRDRCEWIAARLGALCGEPAHPLEMGLRLHDSVVHGDHDGFLPPLALAMCASPFDAALHDAVGIALGRSAFDLYGSDCAIPSADRFFPNTGAVPAVRELLSGYRRELPAWLVVGKADQPGDLKPWIQRRGYSRFKLKIMGADFAEDARRTVEVFEWVRRLGCKQPFLSLDSNEGNPDAASVTAYLQELNARSPEAFAALLYLEQPTGRDIRAHRYDWREATSVKPVFVDEGLTGLDLLDDAREQGWSGLALKTCKGHSFALIAAAWARRNGMQLSMQDLTNPGYAAVHSALFAARINCDYGVELNSPQYTPAANSDFLPCWRELFEPEDGVHRVPAVPPVGLGSLMAG